MYYQIDRTYLTDAGGSSHHAQDPKPHLVTGKSARDAAVQFISREEGRLLGSVAELPGDKATATAWAEGRVYVVFVQRGFEAITAKRADEAAHRSR